MVSCKKLLELKIQLELIIVHHNENLKSTALVNHTLKLRWQLRNILIQFTAAREYLSLELLN